MNPAELSDEEYRQRFAGDVTACPDAAWARIEATQQFLPTKHVIEPLPPTGAAEAAGPTYPPRRDGCMRVVCVSDTHGLHAKDSATTLALPPGDVLVHAGDFSNVGGAEDLRACVRRRRRCLRHDSHESHDDMGDITRRLGSATVKRDGEMAAGGGSACASRGGASASRVDLTLIGAATPARRRRLPCPPAASSSGSARRRSSWPRS